MGVVFGISTSAMVLAAATTLHICLEVQYKVRGSVPRSGGSATIFCVCSASASVSVVVCNVVGSVVGSVRWLHHSYRLTHPSTRTVMYSMRISGSIRTAYTISTTSANIK